MTNPLLAALRQVPQDLGAVEARWALIGGFAVSTRAEPRFTRDIDACVVVNDDSEAEALVSQLRGRGYQVLSLVEQDETGRLATVRLTSPRPGGVVVDLLFASSGIEPELVSDATTLEVVAGLELPVAAVGHLVILKLLAREDTRPQDSADLHALRPLMSDDEIDRARRAARLITERGYDRDRDLASLLAEYLE